MEIYLAFQYNNSNLKVSSLHRKQWQQNSKAKEELKFSHFIGTTLMSFPELKLFIQLSPVTETKVSLIQSHLFVDWCLPVL